MLLSYSLLTATVIVIPMSRQCLQLLATWLYGTRSSDRLLFYTVGQASAGVLCLRAVAVLLSAVRVVAVGIAC